LWIAGRWLNCWLISCTLWHIKRTMAESHFQCSWLILIESGQSCWENRMCSNRLIYAVCGPIGWQRSPMYSNCVDWDQCVFTKPNCYYFVLHHISQSLFYIKYYGSRVTNFFWCCLYFTLFCYLLCCEMFNILLDISVSLAFYYGVISSVLLLVCFSNNFICNNFRLKWIKCEFRLVQDYMWKYCLHTYVIHAVWKTLDGRTV